MILDPAAAAPQITLLSNHKTNGPRMMDLDIPLVFDAAPEWPAHLAPPVLHYKSSPYCPSKDGKVQPILRSRSLLTPDVDLNVYKQKAVIDWVQIRIATPEVHQARNMQPAITNMLKALGANGTVYVSGPKEERRYIGRDFLVKFQQPEPKTLLPVLEQIIDKYAITTSAANIPITGIEISVDIYVKHPHEMAPHEANLLRWQMTDILRRHLRPAPVLTEMEQGWPRFHGAPHDPEKATFLVNPTGKDLSPGLIVLAARLGLDKQRLTALDLKQHAQPKVDKTGYIGPRKGLVMLRTMDKITDRRDPLKGTFVTLPLERQRSRLEVTLTGAADECGGHGAVHLNTIGALYRHSFKELRKPFFDFFLPSFGKTCATKELDVKVTSTEQKVFARSGVYGLDRLHRAIEDLQSQRYAKRLIASRPTRMYEKGRLVAWSPFNQKIYRALKQLGTDWNRHG
jgi:hypothetical protein